MIQRGTYLQAVDNLGIKEVRSIQILGGLNKKIGMLGNICKVSIRELRTRKVKGPGFKKGNLVLALITQTKSVVHRLDGQKVKFIRNSAIILDKQKKPIGSRIGGPICKEFRQKKNLKFTNLSAQII